MALRKCIFVLRIIENGLTEDYSSSTEIINKPLVLIILILEAFTFRPE
jgi:hypothetical protein